MTRTLPGPTRARRKSARVPFWILAVYSVGAGTYVVLFLNAVTADEGSLLHALTLAPILFGLTVPIALRIARTEHDRWFAHVVMAGMILKLLGALARYHIAYNFYGAASTDSYQYHLAGASFAPSFRRLDFTISTGSLIGTSFIKVFTGVVYAVFGTSILGGFFVFAWLSFLGLLLFTRAFRLGVPEGHHRRYTVAVLFLPGLVYWPSAIGKEAFMMLALGLCAYGIAAVFREQAQGALCLALGIGAALLVRPHMALIVLVGFTFALLVRRAPARTYAAPLIRVIGLAVLLVIGLFVLSQTASFLGQPSLTADTVSEQLSSTSTRTGEGGSAFTPVEIDGPLAMFPAFFTVFFRPLPFEVSSAQELATALEGMLLLGLLVAAAPRVRSIPRLMRSKPYVAFCMGYVLAFVFAFSSFANFGILARQRVQAIPFLLVVLALPTIRELGASSPAVVAETTTPALVRPAPGPVRRRRRPAAPPRIRVPVSSGDAPPPRRTAPPRADRPDDSIT